MCRGHEPTVEPTGLDLVDTGNVGGPLMTSVMNGARNGVASRFTASSANDTSTNTLPLNTSTSFNTFTSLGSNEYDIDNLFAHSTLDDLEPTPWAETIRPDSCQSVTPVSTPTPRPSSAPVYSPAAPNLTSPFPAQPSPTAVPNLSTPANPYGNSFSFSPLPESNYPVEEQKPDTKEHVSEDFARLRNLLLKPVSGSDSSNDTEQKHQQNQILKNLLNQEDDEEKNNENRGTSPRGNLGNNRNSIQRPADESKPGGANNMMLLKVCIIVL